MADRTPETLNQIDKLAGKNFELIKTPKISLSDTGLWADILGVEMERLKKDSTLLGQGMENFVVMELRK
jgi:predicted AAA+ superfamily ATPase